MEKMIIDRAGDPSCSFERALTPQPAFPPPMLSNRHYSQNIYKQTKENRVSLQNLERRFGITAVKQDFITAEQLIEALSTQIMEELEGSERRLIGEILLEKEYLTGVQMKEVLKFLGISENFVT